MNVFAYGDILQWTKVTPEHFRIRLSLPLKMCSISCVEYELVIV
jgi:hypothetical protein